MPSKIAGGTIGVKGVVAGKLLELLDVITLKSGKAISLDVLANGGNKILKGVKIPLASLFDYIITKLEK